MFLMCVLIWLSVRLFRWSLTNFLVFHPSVRPFICPSVRPSICPSVRPSICRSVRPSICLSVRPSICPSVRPSICPSVRPSICPSVRPSICPSVRPSICPSARPSFRPSFVYLSVFLYIIQSVGPSVHRSVYIWNQCAPEVDEDGTEVHVSRGEAGEAREGGTATIGGDEAADYFEAELGPPPEDMEGKEEKKDNKVLNWNPAATIVTFSQPECTVHSLGKGYLK